MRTLNRYVGRVEGEGAAGQVTTTPLFSSPADFGRAMVEQIDPPRWGETAREQLLGGAGSPHIPAVKKAEPEPEKELKLRPGKSITWAFGKEFLGINMQWLEEHAKKKGYNLYHAIITRVDSEDNLLDKIRAIHEIIDEVLEEDPEEVSEPQEEAERAAALPSLSPPGSAGKPESETQAGQTPVGAHARRDVQEEITNKIIEAIESGRDTGSFQMPWRAIASQGLPVNAVTNQAYHGINVLTLSFEALERGWPNKWASFQQWKEKGASVKKGEHGVPIVFYTTFNVSDVEEDEEGNLNPVVKEIPVFRYSTVFNITQVDNPPEAAASKLSDPVNRNEAVEQFITSTKADIRYGGNRAFFSPGLDYIQIPPREAFIGTKTSSPTEAFYSTILHELCHWTGGEKRLDRENRNPFGDEAYAKEELVAEIGAAIACATLGITPELREDHIQYVSSWLKLLKQDKRAIFTAAARASRAVVYLENLQGQGTVTTTSL